MRPKNLKYPFKWKDRRPFYSKEDKIFYIPDYYSLHNPTLLPCLETVVFENSFPIHIEYCSGNGAWLIQKAKENPHINWIGVEWRFERARKIWSKMKNEGLKNVLIVAGEALTFTKNYLLPGKIDTIYVNFPDPWPKDRHAKNRLFQEEFVQELSRILKTGGKVIVATDDAVYAQQITKTLLQKFSSQIPYPYYLNHWPNYGSSYFETLWRSKGKEIYYFQFEKPTLIKTIRLPAKMDSDLLFSVEVKEEDKILWEFDFGWKEEGLSFQDQARFYSYTLALEEFVKTVWSQHKEKTVGVVLYRGDFSIFNSLILEDDEEDLLLAQAQIFAEYLHRLASFLPEEITPFCLFTEDLTLSAGKKAQLLSKDRFCHLELSLEKEEPSGLAILLPQDALCSEQLIQKLTLLMESLKERSYRIIPEERLTEMWDGINELIVFEEALSSQGKRKIQGFIASGGQVIYQPIES